MFRLLLPVLLIYSLTVNAASNFVLFHFGANDNGGELTCDGELKNGSIPIQCDFKDGSNQLVVSRGNWGGENAILIKENEQGSVSIGGTCIKSVISHNPDDNSNPNYNLSPQCDIGGIKFVFGSDDNSEGGLRCNGVEKTQVNNVVQCIFDASGILILSRAGWKGNARLLENVPNDSSVTGQCAGSFIPNNETPPVFSVNQSCFSRYVKPIQATGEVLVDEWYSDLPWHQKLSTKDSNLIDTPFVLPFQALPPDKCPTADSPIEKSRCMLRYGIVNIMAMHRTDTLYQPGEAATEETCTDCVQVKIQIQRINTLFDSPPNAYQAVEIRNQPYKGIPSVSFAITEATIFAPWRPWYTGHYCAQDKDNVADLVCYEDYFTTQLIATTANQAWLWDAPAVFEPKQMPPVENFEKYCASGEVYCDMYLGKIDWLKDQPITVDTVISDCGLDPIQDCYDEGVAKTLDLDRQFNTSITSFKDHGRYPWLESAIDYEILAKSIETNPFIGFYEVERFQKFFIVDNNERGSLFRGTHYVLPRQCSKQNFQGARQGSMEDINHLEDCVLNFEIHTSGFYRQWRYLYGETTKNDISLSQNEIIKAISDITHALPGLDANQYGRTMFLYAGVLEQHIPVSFKLLSDGMSLYDKMYNASIYTQYLPLVNPADLTLKTKSYTNEFWHAIFMSNHMNQTPDHFIRGIRGRTLWHNEYRSNIMYNSAEHPLGDGTTRIQGTAFEDVLGPIDFSAGFQVANASAPFHGNTCDSCHIRNGSGVPLMPNGKLPAIHVARGMNLDSYLIQHDYTYSNQELPSMKMVLFDLGAERTDNFYNNKIMNYFGDSFHVNQEQNLPTYSMKYVNIKDQNDYEVVNKTNRGTNNKYPPKRVEIFDINIGEDVVCIDAREGIVTKPDNISFTIWPQNCLEVAGPAIFTALNDDDPEMGFMHLLGRRLGNTPMVEMIPDQTILAIQQAQDVLTGHPGTYSLAPGTRGGDINNYRNCNSGQLGNGSENCYLSRWGWIGDRASLEDQIANAANVEMNMTSTESYNALHANSTDPKQLVRYNQTVCGPADALCQQHTANSDITEQEIKDMATYQRWIGIPNRSEYQVSSTIVQRGEEIFRALQCNSCHVIDKIAFVKDDNMLPDEERDHLQRLKIQAEGQPEYPFISYLGTDLLIHDMGYLSQVAKAPKNEKIRNTDGSLKDRYKNFIQRIRTPALKGLRFNRFVTDSNHNTTAPLKKDAANIISGCDFLLHDGRACDAIEAAFLHDGPAIKELEIINKMNNLSTEEMRQLRAFLYSL